MVAAMVNAPRQLTPAERLAANKLQGEAFEQKVLQDLQQTHDNIAEQVTVRTPSGVRTRVDFIANEKGTGTISITEAKSSETAPLTKRQVIAFPEIAQRGGTVAGQGKPGFPGGTKIPPTKVTIIRP
jgi:hypothetical protein